jgi:hypothetical protein
MQLISLCSLESELHLVTPIQNDFQDGSRLLDIHLSNHGLNGCIL